MSNTYDTGLMIIDYLTTNHILKFPSAIAIWQAQAQNF